MKLRNCLTTFLCSICLLTSCGGSSKEKINYAIGDKTLTTFIDITNDKIDAMIENEESFIIYVYSKTCTSCHEVTPRLESIIQDYGIRIYRTLYSQLDASSPLKLSTGTPILGFYKNGKRLKIIGYSEKTSSHFSTKDNLINLFEQYVSLPKNISYISLDELKRLKNTNSSFVVLFTRASCGDCQELFRVFFNEYAEKNPSKTIYLLECDTVGIRLNENFEYDETLWLNFKEEWELSSSSNAEYGFGAGYVPTFQYYENGVLSDSNVFLNDTYEATTTDIEENGKVVNYTITIKESFFEELVNTTYSFKTTYNSETISRELYLAYRKNVITFHNEKLNEFLNLH